MRSGITSIEKECKKSSDRKKKENSNYNDRKFLDNAINLGRKISEI